VKWRKNDKKWIDDIKDVRDLGLRQATDATKGRIKWKHSATTSSSAADLWMSEQEEEEEEEEE